MDLSAGNRYILMVLTDKVCLASARDLDNVVGVKTEAVHDALYILTWVQRKNHELVACPCMSAKIQPSLDLQ